MHSFTASAKVSKQSDYKTVRQYFGIIMSNCVELKSQKFTYDLELRLTCQVHATVLNFEAFFFITQFLITAEIMQKQINNHKQLQPGTERGRDSRQYLIHVHPASSWFSSDSKSLKTNSRGMPVPSTQHVHSDMKQQYLMYTENKVH